MERSTVSSGTIWGDEAGYSRAVRVGDRIKESGTTATDKGEIVGVVGKNSAGETTLTKAAIGLLEHPAGTVRYRGEDVTDAPADDRARAGIGCIHQGWDVFPKLTVEQNLGVIREMADRCYAMERGTLVDELSGDAIEDEQAIAEYLAV